MHLGRFGFNLKYFMSLASPEKIERERILISNLLILGMSQTVAKVAGAENIIRGGGLLCPYPRWSDPHFRKEQTLSKKSFSVDKNSHSLEQNPGIKKGILLKK